MDLHDYKEAQSRFAKSMTIINLVFWVLIALINFFQDVVLLILQGEPRPWSFAAIFSFDWPLWAAFSPLVVRLAVRFPIAWKNIYQSFFRQLGFATGVVFFHTLFEMFFIYIFINSFFPSYQSRQFLPGYFVASIHSRYIVYFLIVGAAQRFMLFNRMKWAQQRESLLKEKLTAARLESLRLQLQPHFLFNVHHTLSGLILKGENNQAIQMLARLGKFLRTSLQKTKEDFIPLEEEMDVVITYLSIQKVRFQERLQFFSDITPGLEKALVPSFFLQPLVENAVMHGIERIEENGEIHLLVRSEKPDVLTITLENNGESLSEHFTPGIGITNTRERLEALYHDQAVFEIRAREGGKRGVLIQIEIPLHVSLNALRSYESRLQEQFSPRTLF